MKTILVPTDFSRNAGKALDYAISFAKKRKADILLLHVYNIVYISPDVPLQFYASWLTDAENAAEKALKKLSGKVVQARVKCDTLSKYGIAADAILETIKKKKVSLVIMGTRGSAGLPATWLGSTTSTVIARAGCPVMSIPSKAGFDNIKKIIYATDYQTGDIATLRQLVKIADPFKSMISVVHVSDGAYTDSYEKECMDRLAAKIKRKISYKKFVYQLIRDKKVEKKLQQFIKKEKADLLAFPTRHKGLFERLFSGSIVKKLIYHTRIPLIAFNTR